MNNAINYATRLGQMTGSVRCALNYLETGETARAVQLLTEALAADDKATEEVLKQIEEQFKAA